MFPTRSEGRLLLVTTALLAVAALPALAQRRQTRPAGQEFRRIVSSEISLSRDEAKLDLELAGGKHSEFAVHDGHAYVDDDEVGAAPRGGELDRSWRELLNAAMEAPSERLARMLVQWKAPEGSALDARLDEALLAQPGEVIPADATAGSVEGGAQIGDSVDRLVDRISELRAQVEELKAEKLDIPIRVQVDRDRGGWFRSPLRHFFAGLSGIMKVALMYGIFFALSFATIFFGGRRYIEGVADTARNATTRSMLVGLAASFLVIPAFILGIIALCISIIGIPALLVWLPLFPVAAGLAVVLGYVGVAHAAGEALAERRFYASDWFQRGNSYYFLMTGLGLLMAPFIIMNVVRMAGPWLGFLYGILVALGAVTTWAAISIGFGAVLISRAGTRPIRGARSAMPDPEIYAEPTGA